MLSFQRGLTHAKELNHSDSESGDYTGDTGTAQTQRQRGTVALSCIQRKSV
jgi:hypothetical protein